MSKKEITNGITIILIIGIFLFGLTWSALRIESVYGVDVKPCVDIDEEYVKITVYNPVKSQTSTNPLITANGSKINPLNLGRSVAISRDLEARFPMGDSITIYCNCPYRGRYLINDKLGAKAKNQIDVLSKARVGVWYGKIQNLKYEN